MSYQFSEHTDHNIYMDANLADRRAGGIVKWAEDPDTGVMSPTGTTWTQALSGRLSFQFTIPANNSVGYRCYIRCHSNNRPSYIWISLDSSIDFIANSENRPFGRQLINRGSMGWLETSNNTSFQLSPGQHCIEIESIHDSVEIERIVIVPDTNTFDTTIGSGPASINVGGDPEISSLTYIDWLNDETRDPVRVLLLEMSHAGGAVRFASQPFLSNRNVVYDDGILMSGSGPYMEESLGSGGLSVGDVEVATEFQDTPLHQLNFRGYNSRWYYGDLEDDFEDFTLLTTNKIEKVTHNSINNYRFELLPNGDTYNRTFFGEEDIVREGKMIDELEYLLDLFQSASSIKNVNVRDFAYSQIVNYKLTQTTTFNEILDLFAAGLPGEWRTDREGLLEFVVPDLNSNPALSFDGNTIIENSVSETTVYPAYRYVTVISQSKYDETAADTQYSITTNTEVDQGDYNEEIIIQVPTIDLVGLQQLSTYYTAKYGKKRTVYSFEVTGFADVAVVGEYVNLTSELINTSGIITNIYRTPLTTSSTIEIETV